MRIRLDWLCVWACLAFVFAQGCEPVDSLESYEVGDDDLVERAGHTSSELLPGGSLIRNQYLQSSDGSHRLYLQSDGNLVLRRMSDKKALWASGTNGKSATRFIFQGDGNLVLRTSSGASVWSSKTAGSGATKLQLHSAGNLILYKNSTVVWSANGGSTPADNCPDDPNKTEPGQCGCGVPEGTCSSPSSPFSANKSRGEWTLIIIPDTQGYAEDWTPNYPYARMKSSFQWIASNAASMNLMMVQSVGDMTENSNSTEWNRNKECYKMLSNVGVRFSPCQGNHDTTSGLNGAFPVSMFQGKSGWGGHSSGIQNHYWKMTIGAQSYLFMAIQDQSGSTNQSAIDWAKGVLKANPNSKAIIASHFTHSPKKGSSSAVYKQILTQYPQVALSNSGHLCTREEQFTTNGGATNNFLTDYQCDTPGNFHIRIYKFKPLEDRVEFFTYSPVTKKLETDSSSQGSFKLVQAD
jgi:hypothetical protein